MRKEYTSVLIQKDLQKRLIKLAGEQQMRTGKYTSVQIIIMQLVAKAESKEKI